MKLSVLGVVLALFGGSVHAQSANPIETYKRMAGLWAGHDHAPVKISYSLKGGQLSLVGESCAPNPHGPPNCLPLDVTYGIQNSHMFRDDQKAGVRTVEILEVGEDFIVRAERSQVMKNRVVITTERLVNGGSTLEYTVKVLENGKEIASHPFTLDREPGPTSFASF